MANTLEKNDSKSKEASTFIEDLSWFRRQRFMVTDPSLMAVPNIEDLFIEAAKGLPYRKRVDLPMLAFLLTVLLGFIIAANFFPAPELVLAAALVSFVIMFFIAFFLIEPSLSNPKDYVFAYRQDMVPAVLERLKEERSGVQNCIAGLTADDQQKNKAALELLNTMLCQEIAYAQNI